MLMQPFYLGIYRCRTDTTSHEEDLLCLYLIQRLFYQFGRTSQRTYEIMEVFSLESCAISFVPAPTVWNTMVTVPFSLL